MMDLGAMLCTRSKPKCDECPVVEKCQAFKQNRVTDFPYSKPKKEKPVKFVYMLLLVQQDKVYMYQRPATGIWGGLYSYPEFETLDEVDNYLSQIGLENELEHAELAEDKIFRHTFSHYHLDIQPIYISSNKPVTKVNDSKDTWYAIHDSDEKLGKSAVTEKLLSDLKAGAYTNS